MSDVQPATTKQPVVDEFEAALFNGKSASEVEFDHSEDLPIESDEPKGDEADDVEPVDEVKPSESDTGTETGEDDKLPDTGTDTGKVDELLDKHGLSGQYQTVDEALRAVESQRVELGSRDNELNSMRQIISELVKGEKPADAKVEPIDNDTLIDNFNENPRETISKMIEDMGYVKKGDLEPIQKQLGTIETDAMWRTNLGVVQQHKGLESIAEYMIANPSAKVPAGINARWDAMSKEVANDPDLQRMPTSKIIKMAYRLTESVKLKVPPVSDRRKGRASTTSAGRQTQPDTAEIPAAILAGNSKGIEQWLREHGRVD